ncbi:hypothetical protein [Pseudomonas sp. NBRC 111143]|uniref:hypothetical protein n=1 Tax=Pseudomonas sp. NBRC 111143 TaxID=1661058 RepID=UPI0006D3BFA7|nr:hypothetical protein [Pseudomonas sp. NBRC 111143]
MLPQDAKRKPDSYSYPNGMLNSGYIAGVLRLNDPVKGICYIQQTRAENHMLPIHYDPKKSPIPKDIKEWDLIMAFVHTDGAIEGDNRIARVKSIRFEAPNLMHLGGRFRDDFMRKWDVAVHAAAKDSGTPDSVAQLESLPSAGTEDRLNSFDWKAMDLNKNASNQIRIAGFIQTKSLERNRKHPVDGTPINDRLVVLIRQSKDTDACIPVRWYGRNLQPLSEKLARGMPIIVNGEFRMDVKAISLPDGETGIAEVSKIPFIQAKDMPGPVLPDSGHIKIVPSWAAELFKGHGTQAPQPKQGDAERSAMFASAFGSDSASTPATPGEQQDA